ncbi:lish motif-containing protein [Lentinula aciculospora]|uniref:Lish motif-containing protein n=1 Tax=Lentinula aciculospora TaxID=153920 RepID=A0A9W9DW70_9AGAR|nr:lish motif-containing protein [Lentinula aciculospora]
MTLRLDLAEADMLQATPIQLRSLLLDYLAYNGYSNTARSFMRDSAVRHIDVDGDEAVKLPASSGHGPSSSEVLESTLKQAELRKQIRIELRCGCIDEATILLDKYFPDVLSLSTPITRRRNAASFKESSDPIDKQTALLNSAQKLYALVKMLPSGENVSRYTKELESVTGLLAYQFPEKSSVSEFLDQERRDAVADQIDYAILYHVKRPVISYLELYARYTSTILDILSKLGVKPPPSTTIVEAAHTKGQEVQQVYPSFNLHDFANAK